MHELSSRSALELAALIRSGDVSPVELAQTFLARIERFDPALSSFVDVRPDVTLREARAAERRVGRSDAPFHGVPIAIKDLNLAAGFFTRFGSHAFRDTFSPVDDESVKRLRRAGFVVLGKTSVPELASIPVTEPRTHPPTRNPWDPSVTPGGSSGGAGAALAARLTPIAQGSDGGGSIRIPASFCHLYGIKPSRGRVPNAYGMPDRHLLYTDGPLAHTVDDAAAMLDVLAGTDGRSKLHWAPAPARPFAELARVPPKPLQIRVAVRSPFCDTLPEVAAATLEVARTLEALGHHVEEGAFPTADDADFLTLWKHTILQAPVHDVGLLEPINAYLRAHALALREEDVTGARRRLEHAVSAGFAGIDVWLTPSVPVDLPRIGAWSGLGAEEILEHAKPIAAFTAVANIGGLPSASVPMGLSSRGHPIGVMLTGRAFEDATVLALSRLLEAAHPWRHRHAPGFEP